MRTSPLPKGPGRPAKTYSQAHRLIALYDALHKNGRLRLQDVADDYHVSLRTLQRDLALLQEVLPGLVRDEGSKTGGSVEYSLPHAADRWKVQREQLLALAVGASMTAFLSGPHFVTTVRPLLDQLADALPPMQRQRLTQLEQKVVVLEPGRKRYHDQPDVQVRLGVLLDGLLREMPVDVSYLSHVKRQRGGQARRLRVHPLCLAIHRGGVYFVVDIASGDAGRLPPRILLALDRLEAAELVQDEQPFRSPSDFDARTWFRSAFGIVCDRAAARVVLRVDKQWAPYVAERSWHATERFEPLPDGGLLLTMDVGDWTEVVDTVLAMGEHIEVLEPPEMRNQVRERLVAAVNRYARDATYSDVAGPTLESDRGTTTSPAGETP